MTDLVVTVPKGFWPEWIEEGDAVGEVPTGEQWGFYIGQRMPPIFQGERLYIVAWGRLRGWAPVTHVRPGVIHREGGGVAVTLAEPIPGFRGWRRRWWDRAAEIPFPNWMTEGVPPRLHPNLGPGRRRATAWTP